ncbi:MAG: hypothetical protein COZ05_09045 [Armatimonadetes bacterium CG_4_10_14_3_um_filter_59_10]|nr:MAG: hypothetical protein COZ05_09045 [Armatimonadetes bacterium CG_4_10_14_3_um_filter_59_10]
MRDTGRPNRSSVRKKGAMHTPTTAETTLPEATEGQASVTWKSLLAGALLSALLNYLAVRSYASVSRYSGFADHFNTVGVIFLLFWLALFCWVVRRVGKTLLFTSAEFAVVYAMLMVATVIPTMGYGGYVLPLISGVYYYASPENRWNEFLLPHLPRWASPQDSNAIRYVYEGLPHGQSIPWDAWLVPLGWWTLFAFGFFLVSMSLMSLMRRQWVENEKLVYPLSIVPIHLCESAEGHDRFFKSPLMWIGFGSSFFLLFYNFCVRSFPKLMSLKPIPLQSTLPLEQWKTGLLLTFDPLVVGLSSLMPTEVLSGIWIFHLLGTAELSWLRFLGLGGSDPPEPHAAGASSAMANQQVGALFFIVIVSLWTGRGYLKQLYLSIRHGEGLSEREMLSQRRAFVGLVVGLAIMVWFQLKLGLSVMHAAVLLLVTLMMFYGTSRLLAQTGMGRLRAANSGVSLTVNVLGSKNISPTGMAAMGMNFVWAADIQLFVMGTGAHALKVLGDLKVRMRHVFGALVLAFFVSVFVTYVGYLAIGYRSGLIHGFGWYYVNSPQYHWNWIADNI